MVGRELAISMRVCPTGFECLAVSARAGGVFHIAQPTITASTLRHYPDGNTTDKLSAIQNFDEVWVCC